MMAPVFISYSRRDQPYARALAEALRKHGFDVWIDDRIDYGTRWWRTIEEAIQNCGALVVIMTPDSRNSEWVEREILLAQRQNKPIFPLLLKGEEFGLLITTQFVDVRHGNLPPDDFYHDLQLVVPTGAAAGRMVAPEQQHTQERSRKQMPLFLGVATLLVAMIAAGILFAVFNGADDPQEPTRQATEQGSANTLTPTEEPTSESGMAFADEELYVDVRTISSVEGVYDSSTELVPFEYAGIQATKVEVNPVVSSAYAQWESWQPLTGRWMIWAWIPDVEESLTQQARYRISGVKGNDGAVTVAVDQRAFENDWAPLGVFDLDGNYPQAGRVLLNNLTTGDDPGAVMVFSRVRWTPVPENGLPDGFADGFDAPVGTAAERRSTALWPGDWYDANPYLNYYPLGYSTGADLNLPGDEDKVAPVYSIADGQVIYAGVITGNDGELLGFGTLMVIKHDPYLTPDGQVIVAYSRYSPLNDFLVAKGDRVRRGQQIGTVWNNAGALPYYLSFDISLSGILAAHPTDWPGQNKSRVERDYADPLLFIRQHRPPDIP